MSDKCGNCHSCAHWSREKISAWPNRDVPARIGTCAVNGGQTRYWNSADEAQEKILDGYLGGENVYTHENFGCIHFKTTVVLAAVGEIELPKLNSKLTKR